MPKISAAEAAKERRTFQRRTKATAPPDTTDETTTDVIETSTNKFTRRGNSKFKSRKDATKKDPTNTGQKENTGRKENDLVAKRTSLFSSGARNERPRPFARRRPGGANVTTSKSSSPSPISSTVAIATRRPFRIASRRRPVSVSTTTSTTTTTTQATTTDITSEENFQDIGDTDFIEDPTLEPQTVSNKTSKVQRRPLVSLKGELRKDQNPSATNEEEQKKQEQSTEISNEEEKKRQSKKYSASFKQNQLDEVLKLKTKSQEEIDTTTTSTTTEGKTTVDDYSVETAVAIAAHQLLAAPIPIIPDFEEIVRSTKKTTTPKYQYTKPDFSDSFTGSRNIFSEEFPSTPTYKSTFNDDFSKTGINFDFPSTFSIPNTPSTTYNIPRTTFSTFDDDFISTVSRPSTSSIFTSTVTKPFSAFTSKPSAFTSAATRPSITDAFTSTASRPSTSAYTSTASRPSTSSAFTSTIARPAGYSTPSVSSSGFSGVSQNVGPSTARYLDQDEPTSGSFTSRYLTSKDDRFGTSTGRYVGPSNRFPDVDDYGFSTNGYTSRQSQDPSYFTREYLLESPITKTYDEGFQFLSPVTKPQTTTRKSPKRISTTLPPTEPSAAEVTATTPRPRRVPTRRPLQKTVKKEPARTRKPVGDYDYYDDSHERVVVKYEEETKVVLHPKGTIECLDVGNFPHPTSCKKFISCARIENGSLLGWEYVCPKGLSFDPVGGICNWSAGLGCDEKDI